MANATIVNELRTHLSTLNKIAAVYEKQKRSLSSDERDYLLKRNIDKVLKKVRDVEKKLTLKQHRFFVVKLRYFYEKHGAQPSGSDRTEVYYRRTEIKALLQALKHDR